MTVLRDPVGEWPALNEFAVVDRTMSTPFAVGLPWRAWQCDSELSMLGSVPPLAILALMSLNVITVSTGLAVGLAAALLAVDLLAWRVVAAMFDRERLVTGRRG
jgi:hypothetical protein